MSLATISKTQRLHGNVAATHVEHYSAHFTSVMRGVGTGDRIRIQHAVRFPHSLGLFYKASVLEQLRIPLKENFRPMNSVALYLDAFGVRRAVPGAWDPAGAPPRPAVTSERTV